MKVSSERLSLLNLYRLNYQESREWISEANKGKIKTNKGYWLNACKTDKANLKRHCDKLRVQLKK